jgi:hypothetical protein
MDAFVNCEKLVSITIPKDLTVIQAYTFNGCSSLESIVVPDKVTEIATGAFSNCTRLESITIPEGVTKIQSSVFSNCRSLTSVTLPESLASLESYAFQNCLKLESVNIPEKITIIDFGLFQGCTSLKTVTLPKGTTIIGNGLSGNGTFEGCTSLESIDIPASVTAINGTTFRYCKALADVSVNWTETAKIPTPGSNVFSGLTTADIRLHIPAGTKELYEAADVWKTFDIVTNTFVAVTDITDVPAAVMAGDYLPYLRIISSYPPEILLGTVVPADATNKLIEWSVKDAGTTNIGYSDIVTYEYQNGKIVQIREASFHMNNTGTCILTATVTDGLAVGTDYTKDFSITVTSSPTNITVHPQAADYTVGETATALSVTATALNGGTLSYQWYANTTDNNTGGTLITDATGSSYTPPTGTAGTTYYYVEITNSKTGSPDNMIASQTAAITVTSVVSPVNAQTPIISGQPQSVTVVIDAPTTLSVTASVSDNGTLSYQWYSNTADSNTGGTAITGATSSSYSPPTATTGTNWYYVVVTNTNSNVSGIQTATATSNAASVTVEEASTGDEEEDDEDEDDPDSDPDPDPDPEIPTGTEELPQAEALSAYTQNGRLYVTGLIPGQPWRLYSITGSLIANKTAATSEAELSLPARGVYIIQSGKKTIKTVY